MQRLTTYTPILFPFPTPKCEESESIETKIRTRSMSDDRIISSNNNNTINPSKQRTRTRARSPSRSPTSTSTPVSGSPSSRRALDHDQQPGRLFSTTGCSCWPPPYPSETTLFARATSGQFAFAACCIRNGTRGGNRKVSLPGEGRSVNAEIAARGRRSSYSSRGRIVNERICDVYTLRTRSV